MMDNKHLPDSTARFAVCSILHDLGKTAERDREKQPGY